MKNIIIPTKGLAVTIRESLEEAFLDEEYSQRLMVFVMKIVKLLDETNTGPLLTEASDVIEYCFEQAEDLHKQGIIPNSAVQDMVELSYFFAMEIFGILVGAGLIKNGRGFDFKQFIGNDIIVQATDDVADYSAEDQGDLFNPDTDG